MRLWASATHTNTLPNTLKERLALLESAGPWPTRRETARRLLRLRILKPPFSMWFVLGLAASSAAGCAALLYLLFSHSGRHQAFKPDAIAALLSAPPSATQRPRGTAREGGDQLPFFELTLRRGGRGEALFPVRLVGAGEADSVTIMLHGLPAAAGLSTGRRKNSQTWVLGLADLDDLHLILGKGTPDAFDVTIEVTLRSGAQLAKTVARVHLLEGSATRPARASTVETPFRTEVAGHADPAAAAPPLAQRTDTVAGAVAVSGARERRRPPPEGLSALGGPMGGPSPPPPEHRTLWWKMPAVAWTPFGSLERQ
jgi:hypothetical protein